MGNKKKLLSFALSLIAVLILLSVINRKGKLPIKTANQGQGLEVKNSEKSISHSPRLSDPPKRQLSPNLDDSISSNSNDHVVPHIARFLKTGKLNAIRDIPREDIRMAIEEYVAMTSRDELAETLHIYQGMPYELFHSIESPENYLMEVADLIREDIDLSPPRSNIIITDVCAEDGMVSGSTHIIQAGTPRIYAVFENRDALEGVEYIYAVWRNLNDDSLTFSEYEPLRINSRYNYVWLELEEGWPSGLYKLDLADPNSPSHILATEKFKVQ